MTKNKFRIKIGFKLASVLLLIGIIIIASNSLLYNSFLNELKTQRKVFSIYHPSLIKLTELNEMNIESLSLIKNWVFIDKDTGTVQKNKLIELHEEKYPVLKQDFKWYTEQWDKEEQNLFYNLIVSMDSLMTKESQIMGKLLFFDDYQNPQIMFEIIPTVAEKGDLIRNSNSVSSNIHNLIEILENNLQIVSESSEDKFIKIKLTLTWITVILIILLLFVGIMVLRNIVYVTNTLNKIIEKTSKGLLPSMPEIRRKDEIGILNMNLKKLIVHLQNVSAFADEMGLNKFDTAFKPASEDDVLGNALLQMRDNLVNAQKDANERQIENTQRNWASQGIAVFNEVIRDKSSNLEELTAAVIERLVNYTDSNIGGLYIVNEDEVEEKNLELKAFYAYDRHKYIQQFINPGETLVGQCYVENDTIYVSDVPEEYISISSGLGSDKPKSVLIVPLQFNEITYGVVELASFVAFEKHKIDFVEKISETIASAISTAKINVRTTKLLGESNEKSKRLEQQEIQAQKNISKVQSEFEDIQEKYKAELDNIDLLTNEKEELKNKLDELKSKLKVEVDKEKENFSKLQYALNQTMPYFEMNSNGDILFANTLYIQLLSIPEDDVFNNRHINFVSRNFVNTGNYKHIWDKLKANEKISTSVQYLIDGKSKFVTENFIPIINKDEKLEKIIVFCSI